MAHAVRRTLSLGSVAKQHEVERSKIDAIKRHITGGGTVPPVVIALYGKSALPLDGHHRAIAHLELGLSIDAWVISGRTFDSLCARYTDAESCVYCDGVPAMHVAKSADG
jgi:hypothetical protein